MTFNNVKKKLGFGCMRLKMIGDKVDYSEFNKMIDIFILRKEAFVCSDT